MNNLIYHSACNGFSNKKYFHINGNEYLQETMKLLLKIAKEIMIYDIPFFHFYLVLIKLFFAKLKKDIDKKNKLRRH